MTIRETAGGILHYAEEKPEPPKRRVSDWESFETAFWEYMTPFLPEGHEVEEITVGCMQHGPSPRKTLRWIKDGKRQYRTLPCSGCNIAPWMDLVIEFAPPQ